MEFIRFGSSIPGEYWGCCAACIIQNFKQHPDTPASIQLVSGDGGGALTKDRNLAYAGPTLRDVFETRIRIGTFGLEEMPNHAFFAILESSQVRPGSYGYEWLKILKENGFEFLRTVDNSVYTGSDLNRVKSPHPNYVFALFRNIGAGRIKDPFTPPEIWQNLPTVVPEVWDRLNVGKDFSREGFAEEQRKAQRKIWAKGETKIRTEKEIVDAGAPVILAGIRSEFPPQPKAEREERLKARVEKGCPNRPSEGTQYFYPQGNFSEDCDDCDDDCDDDEYEYEEI